MTRRRSVRLLMASSLLAMGMDCNPVVKPSCVFDLTVPSSVPIAGASGSAAVFANPGGDMCGWTVDSDNAWLRVTSEATGAGEGSFTYFASANSGTVRTATVSLRLTSSGETQQTRQVRQEGGGARLTLDPSAVSLAAGAQSNQAVQLEANVPWIVASDQSWLRVTSASSGTGNASITFALDANAGSAARSGTLTVTGGGLTAALTVTQAGASPPTCAISVNPTSRQSPPGGESGQITVTATCAWTATSNQSWLRVTAGGTGSGNGTVSYTVDANSAGSRTGTITMATTSANATFVVTQQPGAGSFLTLNPSTSTPPVGGQSGLTTNVSSNINWSAAVSAGAPWLTLTGGASGSGNGVITYNVAANSGAARSAQIDVTGPGVPTATLTVNQAGCAVSLIPTTQSLTETGGNFSVNISTTCSWNASVTSQTPWLTLTNPTSGTGNATLNYTVQANAGTQSRSGTIGVSVPGVSASLTVNQAGQPALSADFILKVFGPGGQTFPPGSQFTKDGSGTQLYDLIATVTPQAPGLTYQWLKVTSGGGTIVPSDANPTTITISCATQPNSQFTMTIRLTVAAPGYAPAVVEYSWVVFVNQCGT